MIVTPGVSARSLAGEWIWVQLLVVCVCVCVICVYEYVRGFSITLR